MIWKSSSISWLAMAPFYPDWAKTKEAKKEEMVSTYNKNALAGTEKPSSSGTYEFHIIKVTRDASGERVLIEADISGYKYSTVLACQNNIMYFTRNAGPIWGIDKGDTVGFTIQGVQEVPNDLKVGDVIEAFEEVAVKQTLES